MKIITAVLLAGMLIVLAGCGGGGGSSNSSSTPNPFAGTYSGNLIGPVGGALTMVVSADGVTTAIVQNTDTFNMTGTTSSSGTIHLTGTDLNSDSLDLSGSFTVKNGSITCAGNWSSTTGQSGNWSGTHVSK